MVKGTIRAQVVRAVAVILVLAAWALARSPTDSAQERAHLAAPFRFERLPLPSASAGPSRTVRVVEPELRGIRAWISAVGASVALAAIQGDGLPDDACLVDPRTDTVTVEPVPGTGRRFAPFVLDPRPLPYKVPGTAPMGCLPGQFNEDGYTDLLVYYWGRTPVLFLRKPGHPLSAQAFVRRELTTSGARWYTDAVTSADIDGDGHPDLIIGNYFPDGAHVLDPSARADPRMAMQNSFSRGDNGGGDRIFLWAGPGRYREVPGALPADATHGWTLAIGAADLTGDLLPDLYIANDFGPDHLLVNESTPGHVRLREVTGRRTLSTPASFVLGRDSFKGMGVAFADLSGDGRTDIVVSNITSPFALQESNFVWSNTGGPLRAGSPAPFVNHAAPLGIAHSGWGWDVKVGDFDNSGTPQIVQAKGFLRGHVNRWPELQELSMVNDNIVSSPWAWPRFAPGDDLSGHEQPSLFVRGPDGRYVDVAAQLGVRADAVTRGIATADVDGDGRLDMAIASQWGESYFYRNRSPRPGAFLGLDLLVRNSPAARPTELLPYPAPEMDARPAIGATTRVTLPDGRRLVAQVDGGNGHASVSAPEILLGLGRQPIESVEVSLAWRDAIGIDHRQQLTLAPGWHTVLLGSG